MIGPDPTAPGAHVPESRGCECLLCTGINADVARVGSQPVVILKTKLGGGANYTPSCLREVARILFTLASDAESAVAAHLAKQAPAPAPKPGDKN